MLVAALFITAKNLKQHKCPSKGEQLNTLWYIYASHGILLSTSEKWIIESHNLDEPEENYAEWKKASLKKIVHNCIYLTFMRQHNYRGRELSSSSQVLGMGRRETSGAIMG